jgi:hypothetical protein
VHIDITPTSQRELRGCEQIAARKRGASSATRGRESNSSIAAADTIALIPVSDPLRCAVAAVGLLTASSLAACGGDASEPAESVDPRQALACVETQGLKASLKPVANGTELDPTTYLNVDVSRTTTISVAFFTDRTGAQSYVESQRQAASAGLNPNDTELVGPTTALTVDVPGGVEAERRMVLACL